MKVNISFLPDKIFGVETDVLVLFVPLLGVVVAIVFSINLVVRPKVDDYQAMRQNLRDVNQKNLVNKEKTRYLQSIDPDELKKNAESLVAALLPQKNSYLLVGVIKKIAQQNSFQVDSFLISPGKITGDDVRSNLTKGVQKIPIKVSISGPRAGYLGLIKNLEKSLPILSITTLKMSTVGSLTKLELEISAFYVQDVATFDINKLSLADLTLKSEETEIIQKLGEFKRESVNEPVPESSGEIKYDRVDPFTL